MVLGICILLAGLVFLVFGRTVGHGFVNFDDDYYVYDNPAVLKGVSLAGFCWAFTHVVDANWVPLTILSHMVDCQLYGLWAGGHHLINVALHAAAAVLLFLALREMTGAFWRCAFLAAIFAIHPLRVESVAWVAERKDVLSAVFFMLTLWAYARYARRGSCGNYAMVLVWFSMGLMSKPMLVTTPFVLLLLDYWPLGRLGNVSRLPRLLWEKVPLFALSALCCVATVLAQKQAIQPIENLPLSLRIGNALVAYVTYIWMLIYPSRLAVLYPLVKAGPDAWITVEACFMLIGLTVGAYLLRRKYPFLLVGWLWYLGMLVPVIGILQVGEQAYADRYTYLPEIGLCIAGTWAAEEWAASRHQLLSGVAVVVLCAMLVATYRQVSYWRDSSTLWIHTLQCTGENWVAHENLASYLQDQRRTDEAIVQFQDALLINPNIAAARNNLGLDFLNQRRTDEAMVQFKEAMRIEPANALVHNNLGLALAAKGRMDEALAQFKEALRIQPNVAELHNNLGLAALNQQRTDEAIAQFKEALRINPTFAAASNNLADALGRQGRTEEAIASLRDAIRLNPVDANFYYNLGSLLAKQGRAEEAVAQFREVLRIDPASALADQARREIKLYETGHPSGAAQ